MTKEKRIIIIIVICVIAIISVLLYTGVMGDIGNNLFKNKQEIKKDIQYTTYSNTGNTLKILVKYEDTEDGIQEVKYSKNGKQNTVFGNGKTRVDIDYEITEDGAYEFIMINTKGEEIRKTLEINEEYRKNLIVANAVKNESEYTIAIDYKDTSETSSLQYKLEGESDWNSYTENIVRTYTQMATIQKEGTVILQMKKEDNAGNQVIIQNTIETDLPNIPQIVAKATAYPILEKSGFIIQGTMEITFDSRKDVDNYYSLNNGATWIPYTGNISFEGAYQKVQGKSVKRGSGETVQVEEIIQTGADTIGVLAYDRNDTTYSTVKYEGTPKKIRLDASVRGKQVRIKASMNGSNNYDYRLNTKIKKTDGTETTFFDDNWGNIDRTYTLPVDAAELILTAGRIYEIQLIK